MADLFWIEAGNFHPPAASLWLSLINPEFHVPTRAFSASLHRAYMLWELPAHVDELVTSGFKKWVQYTLEATRTDSVDGYKSVDDFLEAHRPEFIRQLKLRAAEMGDEGKAIGVDRWRGIKSFDYLTKVNTSLSDAIRALFEFQITSTWTAFETVCEDLWDAAITCRPSLSIKKAKFRKLVLIRETYSSIEPPSQTIDAILADTAIRKLSLVRNVIVHKSGWVDQQFLDGAAEILWDSGEQLNQLIRLDGNRVKELLSPVVKAGEKLIRAIDVWATLQKRNIGQP